MENFFARGKASANELFLKVADLLADVGVNVHAVFYQTISVKHGAVVTPAKGFADSVEGAFGHLPREIHGDLTGEGDVFGATLAGHVGQANVKMLSDAFLNNLDADGLAVFFVENFA